MEKRVCQHSVGNAVLAVDPTEHETKSAVKQEATEYKPRCQSTHEYDRSRQVTRGKKKRGYYVSNHKHA